MAAASNWSWTSPLSSWGLATSAKQWGQLSQPPRGLWLPQAEPCPQPSGPCWPLLSPWCWKLCSESSPMLSVLTGTTHTVGVWNPGTCGFNSIMCFPFLAAGFPLSLLLLSLLPPVSLVSLFFLLVLCSIWLSLSRSPTLLPKCFVSPSHSEHRICSETSPLCMQKWWHRDWITSHPVSTSITQLPLQSTEDCLQQIRLDAILDQLEIACRNHTSKSH